ncbi:MAG: hypothetical protein HFE74_07550 [Firmicutes bacterium]|jgi:predicted SprT family Zn-dependent metalloprotease|nr:hypothetical protein [Bacillota bacterium]
MKDFTDNSRINLLIEKVVYEIKDIGIPVSDNIENVVINNRTRKRLGACFRTFSKDGKESFVIEISAKALMCDDIKLCSIIAHEILHTCPGSFNHGKIWKEHGRQVEHFLGYSIDRTIKTEELNLPACDIYKHESIKYIIVCKKCGQKYERKRICPLVKNPKKYRCGKCGGKLELLHKHTTSCR